MRISCPLCGERALEEYTYRGDASKQRPDNDDMNSWIDYVFLRDNPKGPHQEYWRHTAGCGAWLVVDRDTRSHEIFKVQLASKITRSQ